MDTRTVPYANWWRPNATASGERLPTAQVSTHASSPEGGLAFWALLGFTVILILAPQSYIPALKPLHIALAAAVLAGAAHLLQRFMRKAGGPANTRALGLVAALAAWCVITVPLSYWPGGSIDFLVGMYFKALLVFWLVSGIVNTVPRLRIIAWSLSLMAIPLAVSAARSFISGEFLQEERSQGAARIDGYDAPLTGNPNDLALMLNLILPLTISLFLSSRRSGMRLLLAVLIFLDMLAIIATYSRAGFLTMVVIVAAYLWGLLQKRQRNFAILAAALIVVGLPFLPASYMSRLSTITNIQADVTGSAQARWRDSLAAIEYVAENPLIGAGAGMDALALNEVRGTNWTEVHNVYLQYAVDLGIPGLVLFLLLLRESLKSARQAERRSSKTVGSHELRHIASGVFISLLAFAVAALFYPDGFKFYFFYIAGLAAAAKAIAMASGGRPPGLVEAPNEAPP
jgi:putative inorganic carbon (HCO3(-)) transporter